jgi:thiamine-phosphate pyrophosphorylase
MKIFESPLIYGLSDTGFDHLNYIRELLLAGIDMVQLRDKDLSDRDFFDLAALLKKTAAEFKKTLIVNDRVDIALILDLDGVHLGAEDIMPEKARAILGEDKIVGYSCHSYQDALDVKDLNLDYISVGPVFKSGTKKDLETIAADEIELIVDNIMIPKVAIGGIGLENIETLKEYGFSNLAIISSLKAAEDKREYINKLREAIKR